MNRIIHFEIHAGDLERAENFTVACSAGMMQPDENAQ